MGDKNANWRLLAWKFTLFLALFGALAGCGKDDPEALLRRELGEMATAVEEHKPADFLRYVTEDFSGDRGGIDKRALHGMLAAQLVGNESVSVTLGSADIHFHNAETATVKVTVLVLGGRYLPERGETLRIESGWKLQGGIWKCYVANWTR